MININIPIFRAKKIDSDKYVVGYYSPDKNYQEHIHTIFYFDIGDFNVDRKTTTQIDPITLAIHFPDMLDSQGNKIFASLREDGKGGDIVKYEQVLGGILKSSGPEECIVKYCNRDHIIAPFFINAKYKNQKTYMTKEHLLVIGIQK